MIAVRREPLAHRRDAWAEVERDALARLRLGPFEPFLVGFLAAREADEVGVLPFVDHLGELAHVRADRQVGVIDVAELVRVGMDVDQRLARMVGRDQRVAVGRRLPEARSDREDQVRVADALLELGVGAVAELPGIDAARVRDRVLAAEGGGDGNAVAEGEVARNDAPARGLQSAPPTIATGDAASLSSSNSAWTAPGSGASATGGTRGRSTRLDLVAAACPREARAPPGRAARRSRRDRRGRHIRGCAAHPRSAPPIWRSGRRRRESRFPGSLRGRGRRGRRRR